MRYKDLFLTYVVEDLNNHLAIVKERINKVYEVSDALNINGYQIPVNDNFHSQMDELLQLNSRMSDIITNLKQDS